MEDKELSAQVRELEARLKKAAAREKKLNELIESKSRELYEEKQRLERNYKRSKTRETSLNKLIESKSRELYEEKQRLERNYKRSKIRETSLNKLIESKSRELYEEKQRLERNYKRSKIKEESLTRLIETKSREIYDEKEKTESLLINVIPASLVEELKIHKKVEAKFFPFVTVLFTDFVGFTSISEKMKAETLVTVLDYCFSHFDEIAEKRGLEKLKTIGDSYMCVGGLPVENNTHAIDAGLASLKMLSFMKKFNEQRRQTGKETWDIRVGINSGPVMAGIIGKKKFAYDIWGDTVNTASRMESSGTSNRVNVSLDTYNSIHEFFEMEHRGNIFVRRKGDMPMFYINKIRSDLSVNGEGIKPNDKFIALYDELKNSD